MKGEHCKSRKETKQKMYLPEKDNEHSEEILFYRTCREKLNEYPQRKYKKERKLKNSKRDERR